MKTLVALFLLFSLPLLAVEPDRLKELDAYWAEVSRAVNTGDFEAYAATCNPEGVLVAGTRKTSTPLASALQKWKREFDDTRAGRMKASVRFKFAQRIGDATTAHETGMFLYAFTGSDGVEVREYIHLEALLTKKDGRWLILMEYQKAKGTQAEFEAL